MRKFLTIVGFGLGGIAVVLGLTLGAYAVVGDPIRQPVVNVRESSTNSSSHSAIPEPEQTPEHSRSPEDNGGSDDTGSDDHGGNSGSGSDDSGGSGSDDSGSDNSGSGSSGSGSSGSDGDDD